MVNFGEWNRITYSIRWLVDLRDLRERRAKVSSEHVAARWWVIRLGASTISQSSVYRLAQISGLDISCPRQLTMLPLVPEKEEL